MFDIYAYTFSGKYFGSEGIKSPHPYTNYVPQTG